jgi:lipopolysaccharide transport system permease protein
MQVEAVNVEHTPIAPQIRQDPAELVIEPRSGWRAVDLGELVAYRDLLRFNIWRGIRARYAQSVLGIGWVVGQPLVLMLIYGLVFGYMARIPAPRGVPYALFAFCGIVPWTFFAAALSGVANSLIGNAHLLTKVYFPRLILPLSEVLARCVDLAISLVILGVMLAVYGVVPRAAALWFVPVMTGVMVLAVLGAGLWLSALAVQYRDVAYALGFLIQIAMFLTPVIYDVSMIPRPLLPIFGLNPMVGVISVYRATLLGTQAIDWMLVGESVAITAILLITGTLFFRATERIFADVA